MTKLYIKQSIAHRLLKHSKRVATGCWLWQRAINHKGYGLIGIDQKCITAHRASYIAFKGVVPKGMLVLHHCDVPKCINPEHLYLGSHHDNFNDAITRNRLVRNTNNGQWSKVSQTI